MECLEQGSLDDRQILVVLQVVSVFLQVPNESRELQEEVCHLKVVVVVVAVLEIDDGGREYDQQTAKE